MKWTSQLLIDTKLTKEPRAITLLSGLIGLSELKNFELVSNEKEYPFLRLNSLDDKSIGFFALDPFMFVKDYAPEIHEAESKSLEINDPGDAIILALATFKSKTEITLNLMAPLFWHYSSNKGKQIVIENYRQVSATYLICGGKKYAYSHT